MPFIILGDACPSKLLVKLLRTFQGLNVMYQNCVSHPSETQLLHDATLMVDGSDCKDNNDTAQFTSSWTLAYQDSTSRRTHLTYKKSDTGVAEVSSNFRARDHSRSSYSPQEIILFVISLRCDDLVGPVSRNRNYGMCIITATATTTTGIWNMDSASRA
ncbi:hypothetical protein Hypma_007483 [Hypsizygus marmoreus]|uniref:Uncharacterized protein n=1 Tax=Hypsizygus marmoreus TaxID=39966 RepID=A0A369JWX8_HYPMA|nr:hypothetical protein Hypma_007483 [Hypsizygus marmoreus]